MSTAGTSPRVVPEPRLRGQTVVLIGGSSGIGLATARQARRGGAEAILTGRNAERLQDASRQVGARSIAAFDANDSRSLARFFESVPDPIDHVLVTAGGPHYEPLLKMSSADVRAALSDRVVLALDVARHAVGKMRSGGTLLFMGMTSGRHVTRELGIEPVVTAALPPFVAALALEVAPARVNLIAAGFVDTALSASVLGDGLEQRREQLRAALPIGRVVEPADVAALAVHLMVNTAVTGATFDIDGGAQFVE
jgi:NAD(P)-dependent dehydrogenase (short-subunit alcohol dehydrogenase family)